MRTTQWHFDSLRASGLRHGCEIDERPNSGTHYKVVMLKGIASRSVRHLESSATPSICSSLTTTRKGSPEGVYSLRQVRASRRKRARLKVGV